LTNIRIVRLPDFLLMMLPLINIFIEKEAKQAQIFGDTEKL
jgi:hypothetical protein